MGSASRQQHDRRFCRWGPLVDSAKANIRIAREGRTPYHGGTPTPELLREVHRCLVDSVPAEHWDTLNERLVREALCFAPDVGRTLPT